MIGSQTRNLLFSIYTSKQTVFSLVDLAMLLGESNFNSLNSKLNYYVRQGKLLNPRKGIYAKTGYQPEELACILYSPSYISLEYVLQKAGVVFQYDERITAVSYLSRTIEIEHYTYAYRKIKNDMLINTAGINQTNFINIATPERAFLDTLYLNSNYYFDNLNPLNRELIGTLLPLYDNKLLISRVKKILKHG